MKKSVQLTVGALALSLNSFAQTFSNPTTEQIEDALTEDGATWINIINYILGFMCFAGLVYVIGGILTKREMSKSIVISWVLCLIIWGLGKAVLISG